MKKTILILAAVTTLSTAGLHPQTAQAQQLDRQLEVTRAYTPKVGQAVKLPVEPNMTDTVRLNPESDFSITPTAWPASFPVAKYAPARMSTASFTPHHPLYIRAGVGYAPKSTFDLYYTPYMGNGSVLGLFVNHRGSYSKIVNDIGIKSDAVETLNGLGLEGSRKVGRHKNFTLDGDVFYENRYYSYYGSGDDLSDDDMSAIVTLPAHRSRSTFVYDRENDTYFIGKVGGGIGFGNASPADFGPASADGSASGTVSDRGSAARSPLNFRLDLDAAFTHLYALPHQADVDFSARIGKMFGPSRSSTSRQTATANRRVAARPRRTGSPAARHGFEVTIAERGAVDVIEPGDLNAVAVTFSPRYLLALNTSGENKGRNAADGLFTLSAGLDLRYIRNASHEQNRWAFAPALEARYDPFGGIFVPFLNLSSRLVDGSYEALTHRNPYIHLGHYGPTGTTTDFRLGAAGNIRDIFRWRISGGMSLLRDYQLFVAEYDVRLELAEPGMYNAHYTPVMFSPMGVRGTTWTIGAEISLLPVAGFSATLSANYNSAKLRKGLGSREIFENGDGTPIPDGDIPAIPGDTPDYDVNLSLSYSYRDIFTVSAGAHLIGDRTFLERRTFSEGVNNITRLRTNHIGPVVGVSLSVEVRAMERLWVFAEGTNLAAQGLYDYNHYRGAGPGVMAGVKMVF